VTTVTASEAGSVARYSGGRYGSTDGFPVAAEAGRSSRGLPAPCEDAICGLMRTRPSPEEIMGRRMQRAHPPLSLIKKRTRTTLATILICGSPADGFQIIGLFADRGDAQSYAEDYSLKDWWIAELTSPEAFAEMQRQRFRALRGPHIGRSDNPA